MTSFFPKVIQGFKRIFFPKKIWQQIFLYALFFVTIPLILLGFLLIQTSQISFQKTILKSHETIAVQSTSQVNERIQGARQALLVTASILGSLQQKTWFQETAIVELSLRFSDFRKIVLVDQNGVEQVSSELGRKLGQTDYLNPFRIALKGERFFSDVEISSDYEPFLVLAEPVFRYGQVVGVLIAELSLRRVWSMIDNIQLQETGKSFLFDHRGRIIAHPDKKNVFQEKVVSYEDALKEVGSGYSGSGETVKEGVKWLIAYAPIEELGWGLVIEQTAQEAYQPLHIMAFQSWAIILGSLFMTVLMSFILSRLIHRPIKDLIQTTEQVSRGNLNGKLKIKRRNEVGRLFFYFNRMMVKLRKARQVERLSIVGRAASSIAHDLKNSVTLVDTFIHVLPERHEEKSFVEDFSKSVTQELSFWKSSLQNMMNYSQLSKFEKSDLDLRQVIEDVLALFEFRWKQKKIIFEYSALNQEVLIFGNAEKLRQVFVNLLTNAFEAVDHNGRIRLDAFVEKGEAVILIYNDISKGSLKISEEIFEPFYSSKAGGLGLGLSICQDILSAHQGKIIFNKNDPEGVTFFVHLPVSCEKKVS